MMWLLYDLQLLYFLSSEIIFGGECRRLFGGSALEVFFSSVELGSLKLWITQTTFQNSCLPEQCILLDSELELRKLTCAVVKVVQMQNKNGLIDILEWLSC